MTYEKAIAIAADRLNLDRSYVRKVYLSFWESVREYASSRPFKECQEESVGGLRPNINIPSLGKFNVTDGRYASLKKKYMNHINDKTEK